MQHLSTIFRSPLGRWLVGIPLLAIGVHLAPSFWPASPTETASVFNGTSTSSTPRPATGDVTREFVVKSAFRTQSGTVLLNDSEDFRDPKTLSVAVAPKVAGVPDDVQQLIGKTVRVTGYTTQYRGRPQIGARTFAVK
jgi:hypothetical protein